MWLKDADDFLASAYTLAVDDPALGLVDDLLDAWYEAPQGFVNTLACTIGLSLTLCLELLLDLLSLLDHLLDEFKQLLIAVLQILVGLLAAPTGGVNQLLGHPPN